MKEKTTIEFSIKRLIMIAVLSVAIIFNCALPFILPAIPQGKLAKSEAGTAGLVATHLSDDTAPYARLKRTNNIGYYLCGNGGTKKKLIEAADGWDVINVSFLETKGQDGFTPNANFDLDKAYSGSDEQRKAAFKKDIQDMRKKGRRVVLSCGGQNGHVVINTEEQRTIFINGLKAIIDDYGFDGFDIDFESTSITCMAGDKFGSLNTSQSKNLEYIVRDLKDTYGRDFIISAAPEYAYVQGAYLGYSGAFLPFVDKIRDVLTYIHPQYYNGFDGDFKWGAEPYNFQKVYSIEGWIKLSEMLMKGFNVSGLGGRFNGLRPDQVAFGVPATSQAAGSGYVSANDYASALRTLCTNYPGYRGIMTWSIGWDEHEGNKFVSAIAPVVAKANEGDEDDPDPIFDAQRPTIKSQPVDKTVFKDEAATLSVSAEVKKGSLSYQWYSNTSKSNSGGQAIARATNSSYSAPTGEIGTKYYYCEVKNTDNSVNGNKIATKNSESVQVIVKSTDAQTPSISTPPADAYVEINKTTTLSVTAESSSGTLSYQWYSNTTKSNNGGSAISGATDRTYSPAASSSVGKKYYYCVVTNTDTIKGQQKTATAKTNAIEVNIVEKVIVSNKLKKHINVGYYLCGNGKEAATGSGAVITDAMKAKPSKKLSEVADEWDVLNVSFMTTTPPGASQADGHIPYLTLDLGAAYGYSTPEAQRIAEFKEDIRTMQARGKKIVISFGGEKGGLNIEDDSNRDIFLERVIRIIEEYGFDGFDIDLEGASIRDRMGCEIGKIETSKQTKNLVHVVKKLVERFRTSDNEFIISAAPEAYYVNAHKYDSRGASGAFLGCLDAIRNELTYIHPQVYNGCFDIMDNSKIPSRFRVPNTATLEGYVKVSRMLIEGFESKVGWFNGLRPDQVAFGVPASKPAAGSGYNDASVYAAALDALIEEFPTYRGIMTWSTGHDEIYGESTYGDNRFSKVIGRTIAKHNIPYDNAKAPKINTQPIDITVPVNNSAYLSVEAGGSQLSYQWYETSTKTNMGGTKVVGATNSQYEVPTNAEGTKYYYCEVTAFDEDARVNKTAVNRTRSTSVTVDKNVVGNEWDRRKSYNGGSVVTWKGKTWKASWYANAGQEPGTSAGNMWVGEDVQAPIHAQAPNITTQAENKVVSKNGDGSLSVSAEITSGNLSYQWYETDSKTNLDGRKITGADKSTYRAPTGATGTKYYFCIVTNTDNASTINGDKTASTFSDVVSVKVEGESEPAPNVGWNKFRIYQQGEILSGEGRYFRAERVTKGEQPGKSDAWVEAFLPFDGVVDYEVGAKYRSMTIVRYQSKLYQATRFTTTVPGDKGWREIA